MIEINGEQVKPYVGEYKPLAVYEGTEKLAGWIDKTANAVGSIPLSDTYNTGMGIKTTGKAMQVQTKLGVNLCPNVDSDKWVLSGGAYKENGYIVLPQVGAKAEMDVEWNGQKTSENGKYVCFWGANFVTEDVENGKYLVETIYLNEDKEIITSNGNASLIGGTDIWKNFYFAYSPDTIYGQGIRDAKYIKYRITFGSSNTVPYKFKDPMISKTSCSSYVGFIPNSPSPDYPSPVLTSNFTGVKVSSRNMAKLANGEERVATNEPTIKVENNIITLNGTCETRTANQYSVKFSGNSIRAANYVNSITLDEDDIVLKKGQYKLKIFDVTGEISNQSQVRLGIKYQKKGESQTKSIMLSTGLTSNSEYDLSLTSEEEYQIGIALNCIVETSSVTFNNVSFKCMLTKHYPTITMTLDNESGNYYLDGITTQDGTPSPDNMVDFANTYKAGTYQTVINDKTYIITLSDDLRSVTKETTIADRLWLDIENAKAWVEKKIYITVFDKPYYWGNDLGYENRFSKGWEIPDYGIDIISHSSFARCNYFEEIPSSQMGTNIGMYTLNSAYLRISYPNKVLSDFKLWVMEKALDGKPLTAIFPLRFPVENLISQECYEEKYEYTQYREPLEYSITTQNGFPSALGVADSIEFTDETKNYIQRVGKVTFNGTEEFANTYGTNLFNKQSFMTNIPNTGYRYICNYYKYNPVQNGIDDATEHGEFAIQIGGNLFFKDTRFSTATEFNQWLEDMYEAGKPVEIYYQLNSPITTPISEISEIKTLPQSCSVNIEADMDLEMEVDFKQMDND